MNDEEKTKKAMQELGLYPSKTSAAPGPQGLQEGGATDPTEKAMLELGYIKPEGPSIVYPEDIDDNESDIVTPADRMMALNFGDPSGSYNKLKSKYGPKGYDFSQSTEGDIVFKSPAAEKWSRLDPREPSGPYNPFPNAIITKDIGRDVVDVLPDVVQGGLTGMAVGMGALRGGRAGMTAAGGLAGALGEAARQSIGKATGYREGPYEPIKIAAQGVIDAALPNLVGSGLSKKQIEAAMTKRGILATVWDLLNKSDSPDQGVRVLNRSKKGLEDLRLPPELVGEAATQFKESTKGLIPATGKAIWSGIGRIAPDMKERAFRPIKDSALSLLEDAGVKFGLGMKPPKNLAEAAPFLSSQGKAGEAVKVIIAGAKKAREDKLAEVGGEIESSLSKITDKIDMSNERDFFDNAIASLEAKKSRDPMKATQSDKLISAIKSAREQIFGAPDESLPIEELRKEATDVLTATARKGKTQGYGFGDMLYNTPEAATGRLKEAVTAVENMTPEKQYAAAGIPIPRDALGTPISQPPISKDAKNKLIENTYFKMFGVKPPRPDLPKDLPEGLDSRGARIWATAQTKKMSRSELLKAAGKHPGKSAEVDPDIAWSKFLTLKQMAGYFKRSENPDLVSSELTRIAADAERSLSDKIYKKISDVSGKDLRNQYKIYVYGDEDVSKLLTSIDKGLSTSGKAFIDSKSHIKTAIEEYDKLYGTNLLDQLEVLSVAKEFGTEGNWFPTSGSGATSTGVIIQGGNVGKATAGLLGRLFGLGQGATSTLESAGQITGGMAGSSAAVRRAARLGNFLDKVYGEAGGNWNPISTRQMLGSPWLNLENTDQNKKLLRERYQE